MVSFAGMNVNLNQLERSVSGIVKEESSRDLLRLSYTDAGSLTQLMQITTQHLTYFKVDGQSFAVWRSEKLFSALSRGTEESNRQQFRKI